MQEPDLDWSRWKAFLCLLIGKAGRAPRLLLVAVVAEWWEEDEWARQARAPRDNKGRDQN